MFSTTTLRDLREPLLPPESQEVKNVVPEIKLEIKLEIKEEREEESFDALDTTAKKLNNCIALLNAQIKKQKAASCVKYSFTAGMLAAAGISLSQLLTAINTYNSSIEEYKSTIEPNLIPKINATHCGDAIILALSWSSDYFTTWLSPTACLEWIEALNDIGIPNCTNAFKKICDGPGMWKGYATLVIGLGIVLPGAIAASLIGKKLWDKYKNIPTEKRLCDLPRQKAETIQKYLTEYKIPFTANDSLINLRQAFLEKLLIVKKQITHIQSATCILSEDLKLPSSVARIAATYLDSEWGSIYSRNNLFAADQSAQPANDANQDIQPENLSCSLS